MTRIDTLIMALVNDFCAQTGLPHASGDGIIELMEEMDLPESDMVYARALIGGLSIRSGPVLVVNSDSRSDGGSDV